ncbi:MAG: DNA-processing protein DprA [Holosporales bacterium]|jgi:DNA processing protein|nr:DNA-processing protein DprA [Holosporales bacterium]
MIDDVILDWFCLINSKGIGPKTFWALMRSYKSARESLKHVTEPFPKNKAEKILHSMNCGVILANDEMFPKLLRRSCFCPPILFYKGDKSLLLKRKIAIIGARNASISGKSVARRLASSLSNDFAIVSGLAKGIDSAAHLGSLEYPENKSSIAILPFGLDNIYPKENLNIFNKIASHGLVLTEVSHGNKNEQGMFAARNRIVALISECVIVIEAGAKSGTMATAKLALDLGCEVLVVPGSPIDPRNFGSNLLIKNGAGLIQSYTDVLDVLNFHREREQEPMSCNITEKPNLHDQHTKILSMLSETPISLDELAMHSNMNMATLLRIVSELEITGKIEKHETNAIVLRGF